MEAYSSGGNDAAAIAVRALGHTTDGAAETISRIDAWDQSMQLVSQELFFGSLVAPSTMTIARLRTACGNQGGVGTTLCRMGLFTIAANGDLTLAARTANDPTFWSATGSLYTAPLDTAGGYPASFRIVAGIRYAIGVISVGPGVMGRLWSVGPIITPASGQEPLAAFRAFAGGWADLPASLPAAGYGGSDRLLYAAALIP